MNPKKYDIKISVELDDKIHLLETYTFEYRSLMHLIFDRIYIEDFGDCRGMGRCGTCAVQILNRRYTANDLERNELTTLNRAGELIPNTRLACQILIDERINDLHCKVLLPDAYNEL